jgi:hypothetical protein
MAVFGEQGMFVDMHNKDICWAAFLLNKPVLHQFTLDK